MFLALILKHLLLRNLVYPYSVYIEELYSYTSSM